MPALQGFHNLAIQLQHSSSNQYAQFEDATWPGAPCEDVACAAPLLLFMAQLVQAIGGVRSCMHAQSPDLYVVRSVLQVSCSPGSSRRPACGISICHGICRPLSASSTSAHPRQHPCSRSPALLQRTVKQRQRLLIPAAAGAGADAAAEDAPQHHPQHNNTTDPQFPAGQQPEAAHLDDLTADDNVILLLGSEDEEEGEEDEDGLILNEDFAAAMVAARQQLISSSSGTDDEWDGNEPWDTTYSDSEVGLHAVVAFLGMVSTPACPVPLHVRVRALWHWIAGSHVRRAGLHVRCDDRPTLRSVMQLHMLG